MSLYTLGQVCKILQVNPRTLSKWLEIQGIEPETPQGDRRKRRLNDVQLQQIATIYERVPQELYDEAALYAEIEQLRKELQIARRRIAELESRSTGTGSANMIHHPTRAVEGTRIAPNRRSLPEGWISLTSMCHIHGIVVTTAKEAVKRGDLSCEEEHEQPWVKGSTRIEYALTPEQQDAFKTYYGLESPVLNGHR